jgi:serine/threonine protein kinase
VYLRKQNIVHRDLKPANIVLNEKMQIQVTDFGTAKSMIKSTTSNYDSSDLDISYVSANSNMSALSGISGMSSNLNTILSNVSNDRIPLQTNESEDREELVGSEHYISPEMLELR